MVNVISESDEPGCWMYRFECLDDEGRASSGRFRLAWEDYDLWIPDGTVEPARVAEAVLRFVIEQPGLRPFPERIDSSHPRRMAPGADERIIHLIRNGGSPAS